jgi:DNA-binding transcriptional ArsR family regulator
LSAGQIANHFNISKPSISHHLDILKRIDNHFRKKKTVYHLFVNIHRDGRRIAMDINFKKIESMKLSLKKNCLD